MVKIRLKRLGARKRPFYRLVVADARSPRDGRFIEELGTYDPITKPATVVINADRVRDWMSRGAQPSDTARSLLEQQGILPRTERRSAPAATPAADVTPAAGKPAAEAPAAAEEADAAEPDTADSPTADATPAEEPAGAEA